jgi:ABC-type transporter Mla subunit MlaD
VIKVLSTEQKKEAVGEAIYALYVHDSWGDALFVVADSLPEEALDYLRVNRKRIADAVDKLEELTDALAEQIAAS